MKKEDEAEVQGKHEQVEAVNRLGDINEELMIPAGREDGVGQQVMRHNEEVVRKENVQEVADNVREKDLVGMILVDRDGSQEMAR